MRLQLTENEVKFLFNFYCPGSHIPRNFHAHHICFPSKFLVIWSKIRQENQDLSKDLSKSTVLPGRICFSRNGHKRAPRRSRGTSGPVAARIPLSFDVWQPWVFQRAARALILETPFAGSRDRETKELARDERCRQADSVTSHREAAESQIAGISCHRSQRCGLQTLSD